MPTDDGTRKIWVCREASEGSTSATSRFRQLRTVSHKFISKFGAVVPSEYGAALVDEYAVTQTTSHGEWDMVTALRPDDFGWLALSAIGAPTITLQGTGTNNVQTLVFGGTWANGDTFSLTFNGYTAAGIVYSTTAATLGANIATAIAALPSISSAIYSNTTKNCNVTVTGTTAATVTFTFMNNLQNYNMPLGSCVVGTSAAGTVTSFTNTTPGVGAYRADFLAGATGKPTLGIVEYDGTDYRLWKGSSVNTWEIARSVTEFMKCTIKGLTHTEASPGASLPSPVTTLPTLLDRGYNVPFTPASYVNGINYRNVTYTLSKGGKISGTNNRTAIYAEGNTSIDVIRHAEGKIKVAYDITVRNTGFAGSAYSDLQSGTIDQQNLTITAQDSLTNIGAGGTFHPSVILDIQNPRATEGERDPMKPEVEVVIKGSGVYDTTQAAPIKISIISEEKWFGDIPG